MIGNSIAKILSQHSHYYQFIWITHRSQEQVKLSENYNARIVCVSRQNEYEKGSLA